VPTRRTFLGALTAGAALPALGALAGCDALTGAKPTNVANPQNLEKPRWKVGVIPSVGAAALYIAAKSYDNKPGFFEREGLSIEIVTLEGGAAGLQKVIANKGELDCVLVNNVAVIQAVAKDAAKLKMIFEGPNASPKTYMILTSPQSGIKDLTGLRDKTLGVSSKADIITYAVKDHLQIHGVDPATVSFAEIPYKDGGEVLNRNNIPATVLTEPYLTQTLRTVRDVGLIADGDIFPEQSPTAEMSIASYTVNEALTQQSPNSVHAFMRAMNLATAALIQSPQMIREIVPGYAKIDAGVAEHMGLPKYQLNLDVTRMQRVADLVLAQKGLPAPFQVKQLIYTPPS
jgi:NitT/TauT family transport system substrate-binding protein